MRKQDRSSIADCREYLFIGNMVGAGKLQSGQLSPAALEKSGHFCPRKGRAGGNFLRAAPPHSASSHSARAKFMDCSRSVSWQMFCSTVSHSARNA